MLVLLIMVVTLTTPSLEHIKGKRNIISDNSVNAVNKNLVGKSHHVNTKVRHHSQHLSNVRPGHPVTWAVRGETVSMECPVNTTTCGQYHSVKWYRDETRVGVYSPSNHWHRVHDNMADVKVTADNETVSLSWSVTGLINEGNTKYNILCKKSLKVLQPLIDEFLIKT